MLDYINGNKFSDIADFVIDFDHHDLTLNFYKKDAIIFCKTDFLNLLFDHIKFSKRKYVLITHMSDYPIDKHRFDKSPPSIVKWYAQNAVHEHPNLVSVPLGLENHTGKSKGKFTNHDWFLKNDGILRARWKEQDTLYCNWNPDTNQEVRKPILEKLKANINIKHESGLSFETYCNNMSYYKFVVCPPGNGADTHRLWEALYLGCYPITLRNRIYRDYNLPILQVDDWSEVTSDLVNKFYWDWNGQPYHHELQMSHWEKIIKNEISLHI